MSHSTFIYDLYARRIAASLVTLIDMTGDRAGVAREANLESANVFSHWARLLGELDYRKDWPALDTMQRVLKVVTGRTNFELTDKEIAAFLLLSLGRQNPQSVDLIRAQSAEDPMLIADRVFLRLAQTPRQHSVDHPHRNDPLNRDPYVIEAEREIAKILEEDAGRFLEQ